MNFLEKFTIFCVIYLLSFPFSVSHSKEQETGLRLNKSFLEGEYLHLESRKGLKKNIRKFDLINLKVFNPSDSEKLLYFVVKDDKSKDYWGQFTFKTRLVRGRNDLWINLDRFVGERGSHRYQRKINKNKIREIFLVFNPDKKSSGGKLRLESIGFKKNIIPIIPQNVRYFVFGNDQAIPFGESVDSSTKYDSRKGYGFKKIDLWQARDAKIAPQILAKTLSVKSADFLVNLKAGKYQLEIIWDELGYWEVPFWKNRRLFINKKPVAVESRGSWKAYLEDYFFFKKLTKKAPLDQLLLKLKPLKLEIDHKGGILELAFEGDPTGISLNTLLIYPEKTEIKVFKKELYQYQKSEFEQLYREVKKDSQEKIEKKIVLSDASGKDLCLKSVGKNFVRAKGGSARLWLCIWGAKDQKISLDFKSDRKKIVLSTSVSQYKALDLGHESFQYVPSFFEPGMPNRVREDFQIIELEITPESKNKLDFTVKVAETTKEFNLNLFEFPGKELPVQIGLFGPLPIQPSYFEARGKTQWLNSLKKVLIKELQSTGINFVTDLYQPKFRYLEGNEYFVLKDDASYLSSLNQEEIFFYNSKYWKELLEGHPRNSAQSESEYRENLNLALKKLTPSNLVYLYSDEATGYRNAVEYDLEQGKILKKRFPTLKLGGFANPYDMKKAKKLYEIWDYIFFSDFPDHKFGEQMSRKFNRWGLYNLCSEIEADLETCYGVGLYALYRRGLSSVIEWHLHSGQNYPYFDLDGREADIAFFKTDSQGTLYPTIRYRKLQVGLLTFQKLLFLEDQSSKGKLSKSDAKWLGEIEGVIDYPLKRFLLSPPSNKLSNFYRELDARLIRLLEKR